MKIKVLDERGQIAYSSGPFRGSEAYRDACRSTLTNSRLLTGATMGHRHIHTFINVPHLSLSCSRPWCFLFQSFGFGLLCFATFSSVCFIEGPHLAGLGAFLHVQSLCPIANLPRLSVPFYVQVFFFPFFPCLLSACFYFSTIKKSFRGRFSGKACDVSLLSERHSQGFLCSNCM